MKTQKEKVQDKIDAHKLIIKQLTEERTKMYDSLKDFTLSANKSDIVLGKMHSITLSIKAEHRKLMKCIEQNA